LCNLNTRQRLGDVKNLSSIGHMKRISLYELKYDKEKCNPII
jgi:hypothetical protein